MARDRLGPVFKALAHPVRRAVLDLLREAPRTSGEVCAAFRPLSRFAVLKHLAVLKVAGLVRTRPEGRLRVNALDPLPLQEAWERWMKPYEGLWASRLLALRRMAEAPRSGDSLPAPAPARAGMPAPSAETPSRARSPGTRVRPSTPKETRP